MIRFAKKGLIHVYNFDESYAYKLLHYKFPPFSLMIGKLSHKISKL